MKKVVLLLIFSMMVGSVPAGELHPYFHFDFGKAAGKTEIADETGRIVCHSKSGPFVVQENALRLAEGAKFYIEDRDLPPLDRQFTFSIWAAKCFFGDVCPLVFKGLHPEVQLLFSIFKQTPDFVFKNEASQRDWEGIFLKGGVRSSACEYNTGTELVNGKIPWLEAGQWYMLSTVFDRGNITIYLNGVPVLHRRAARPESLKKSNAPLWLGAETVPGTSLNYRTSNLFVNDFYLFDRALSDPEILQLFRESRKKYPEKNLLPPGEVKYPDCNAYLTFLLKGLDPEFKVKLPLTAQYEKNLPKPLPAGKGNTSSKIMRTPHDVLTLEINGKDYFPLLFFPASVRDNRYIRKTPDLIARDFAAAGFELMGTAGLTPFQWQDRRQYDFASMDESIRSAFAANPKGYYKISFFVRPTSWFFRKHGDQLECFFPSTDSHGKLAPYYIAAPFGSEIWLFCSDEMLETTVRHIESQDYADRIFAYHLYCGDAGEWYWSGSFTGGIPGYSAMTREAFRNYLKKRYPSVEALREAWGDPKVTFADAAVPSPEFRLGTERWNFRDPNKARPVIDFREYQREVTLRELKMHCATLKKASGYKKLVMIYFGYPLLYAGLQNTMQYGALQALGEVLRNRDVDCIATPLDYNARRGGEPGANINAFNGSACLHGKMLWYECDLRTHLHDSQECGRTDSPEETVTVMRRCFGQALTRNAGYWYCVLGRNYEWHTQEIQEEAVAEISAGKRSLQADRSPIAQTAIVFDEKSTYYTSAPRDRFIHDHNWTLYLNAMRMGAPFDCYLLDDIDNPSMPDYKLYIFTNCYYTTPEVRTKIRAKLEKSKAVAVWCYAPGYLGEYGFDPAAMKELTGLDLREVREEAKGGLIVTDRHSPITSNAKPQKSYPVGPWFYCADPRARVLGTFQGKPALVVKDKIVWSLMPLDTRMLTGLCDFAGVHVFSRSGDVLTANRSFIMLHTGSSGDKTIFLPEKCGAVEMFTGKKFPEAKQWTDPAVPAQATRIYQLDWK